MNHPHFLTRIFQTQQFKESELDIILPAFTRVTFAKNEFLLSEGKTAGHYWFVESGFIRAFVVDPAGNDVSTHFYTVADIVIDWPSFFMRKPTRENIQALTDCVCWQLDYETFQQMFNSIESFRESGKSRLVASYFELKNHGISMIADQAKDRYKRLLKEKPLLLQNVSLKQLASYLGITDTSLSRIRKEISNE